MSDPARTAVIVTLVSADETARKLIVSWSLVGRTLRGRAMLSDWSRASGVPISQVERLSEVLLRHGICRPDGTADPESLRVVQHVAAETLRSSQRSRR